MSYHIQIEKWRDKSSRRVILNALYELYTSHTNPRLTCEIRLNPPRSICGFCRDFADAVLLFECFFVLCARGMMSMAKLTSNTKINCPSIFSSLFHSTFLVAFLMSSHSYIQVFMDPQLHVRIHFECIICIHSEYRFDLEPEPLN